MKETFDWLKPSPIWQENGSDLLLPAHRDTFRQPQVLEFQSDDFIDQFFSIAANGKAEAFPIAKNPPLDASKKIEPYWKHELRQ